jgi:hypothetical protein
LTQRLADYGTVVAVVLVLAGLFRLARFLLGRFVSSLRGKGCRFSSDDSLLWGMRFLLVGLIFLPFITSLLAFADNSRLPGGMALHLFMTVLSVLLFSFAEDLFRDYNSYADGALESLQWHGKRLFVPVVLFWVIGCVFISPLFYSGLTILVCLFYRLCLYFRKPAIQKTKAK